MKSELQLVLRAASFAAARHKSQRRKDAYASPYINHPLSLADILVNEGGVHDPEVVAAALLHDTIEDTETSIEELQAAFGERVAQIVVEVTDDKALPAEERKRLQVVKAKSKSEGAKLVGLADKISNVRDLVSTPPVDWPLARKTAYLSWSRDVVTGLRGANARLESAFDRAHAAGVLHFQLEGPSQ